MRTASRSRGSDPEVSKSEGARAPSGRHPIFQSRQPFGAHGGVLCRPRARYTYASEPSVPPGCSESGLSSFAGPSGGCACQLEIRVGAPLATGCRAFHCWKCTASSHLPRPSEGASLYERATPPQAGHRPCPATDAQLMRPLTGRVAMSLGEARRAGIRKLAMSAMGHVWTAPGCQGIEARRSTGRSSHVFGLSVRLTRPLAIMPSADRVPVKSSHSTMLWPMWVVLITGSTGSALRAVGPFQPLHRACWRDPARFALIGQVRLVLCSARLWPSSPRPCARSCWRARSRRPSSAGARAVSQATGDV